MSNIINATRMELMLLKNKLITAERGHKLLKDKQDELIKQFLALIANYKQLRQNVFPQFTTSINTYEQSLIKHTRWQLYEKMMVTSNQTQVTYEKKNIMGVYVPQISWTKQKVDLTFSFMDSDNNLDESILQLGNLFPQIIELAMLDKSCLLLANEIEKVKRRVNAIEHFMIPELMENIKEVTAKLSDSERANIIRTMKSKEIVLKKKKVTSKEKSHF